MKATHHFGWTKDDADGRDHIFEPAAPAQPGVVDLSATPYEPPVLDQLRLLSYSAHAVAALIQYVRAKEALESIVPSRLFIYYNERKLEDATAADCGASIRNGIKSVAQTGICHEDAWPYDISKFAVEPPAPCYEAAAAHRAITYARITGGLGHLRACLAAGYPFIFGMNIFTEFTTPAVAKSGVFPMPDTKGRTLGGHAVMAVGYDDGAQTFKVRNSVGSNWGMAGYFTVPYAFMESRDCSDDFWTVRTAT